MKVQGLMIVSTLLAGSSLSFGATSYETQQIDCNKQPFAASECLSLLAAPKGLPPTVKVEEFRGYAQKLLSLSEELPETLAELEKLKAVEFAPRGKAQLEKALKLTSSILADVELAKQQIGSFADLQYHASRASLDAGRVGNALAELRLAVVPSAQAQQIFEFLKVEIETFDALGAQLMPDWLI